MIVAGRKVQGDGSLLETLSIRSGGCTVVGKSRRQNEDGLYIDRQNRFFVVTDGMGGELAGDVASRMAIRALSQRLGSIYADEAEGNWDASRLADVLIDTNRLMVAAKGTDARLAGMGTTAVIAAVRGRRLLVAGLGDSRVYLVRGGRAVQLTIDHSVAQSLVDAGMIPAASLPSHPFRNVLHQFLGCSELGEGPCARSTALEEGDRILLASDGLTDRVDAGTIAEIVSGSRSPRVAAERLKRRATVNGATDDVTCVAVFVDAEEPPADVSPEWSGLHSQLV